MIYKYYTYNTVINGQYVGSRVIRVLFYKSPFRAMKIAMDNTDGNVAIVDFKKL